MALSSEQIYDELNGREVKDILVTRFKDLLDSVSDFQPHLTLPRVRMQLKVHLDVWGRRNPSLDLETDLTLTLRQPVADITLVKELEAEVQVNADTGVPVPNTPFTGDGQAPDEVRVEHDLPTMEPFHDRAGLTQQRPFIAPQPQPEEPRIVVPPPVGPGGRRWGGFRELARAGPVVSGNLEYLEPPILPPPTSRPRDKPEIGIQKDFRDLFRVPPRS